MDETNDRNALGEMEVTEAFTIGHTQIGEACKSLPEGVWRVYAERRPEKPLNERMAHYWGGWWGPTPTDGIQRAHRMQRIIDEFGLVERSKMSDPIEVPDEIERLQLSLAQVRAEQVRLMRWKRRWDELAKILEDPENTFQDADGVLEVMDAMESGVNPDD